MARRHLKRTQIPSSPFPLVSFSPTAEKSYAIFENDITLFALKRKEPAS
jgi:hypothetical protein